MINIIRIADPPQPELALYSETREARLLHAREPDPGFFIAESALVIGRALDAGYEPVSLLADTPDLRGASGLLQRLGDQVPVYAGDPAVTKKIRGYAMTRGIMCAMKRRALPSVRDVLSGAHRAAVLDDVTNPTNVGAIFRSAAALGMDAVILGKGCGDPLYRRASRVSMGTVFQIPWTSAGRMRTAELIARLRKAGFCTAAMALRPDALPPDDPSLVSADRLAVILGNEGYGLAGETVSSCDASVMIPMAHGVDSLNVAAASAVIFWQLSRREQAHTPAAHSRQTFCGSSGVTDPDPEDSSDRRIGDS